MTPFVGQISPFSFSYAPKGWAFCNGQLLPIAQNQALFTLLGTTYGGDGKTTFALPNLQGYVVVGSGTPAGGTNYVIGQTGGEASHTLITAEMPAHNHTALGSAVSPNAASPQGNYPCILPSGYASTGDTTLGSGSTAAGGGQPHPNQGPFLVMSYCISLTGIYPSQN